MSATYFMSDPHLGHKNIITFKDNNGKLTRPFRTIEEMDETIISSVNSVVKPQDRLYILGDVVINRKNLPTIARLNGRKKLIKGNHDIFKLKDYTPYFDDIVAYRIYPKYGLICTHMPIHPYLLENRWKANVHGHTHQNDVVNSGNIDKRYVNICVEKTNYTPVSFDELLIMCDMEKIK